MNLDQLEAVAKEYLAVLQQYSQHYKRAGERFIDLSFYAMLNGRFANMSRQLRLYVPSSSYPLRIDYRCGGNNPVLIELAVRPFKGGQQFDAKPNRDELRKLARFPFSRARVCVLLLLDLYPRPKKKALLRRDYTAITSEPGRYTRHPVTVMYIHEKHDFRFEWCR